MDDEKNTVTAYKGFNSDWTCRGYRYEVGQSYKHDGAVVACSSGFHACTDPRDVLSYYPPTGKIAVVEMGGEMSRDTADSKIAAGRITIKAELSLPDYVDLLVRPASAAAKWVKGSTATGDGGAASATGDGGAASATGYGGAASATGYGGASLAGNPTAVALASGYMATAQGVLGAAICLIERDSDGTILSAWAGKVDGAIIKANTPYRLIGGRPVEAT